MFPFNGWLAYNAYVLLSNANVNSQYTGLLIRWRIWFKQFFDGFGDHDPDDSFDAGDL